MEKMHIKRFLTICLALMLSVSMLPAGVFATDDPAQGGMVLTETDNNDGASASGQDDKAGQATDQNGPDNSNDLIDESPPGGNEIVGGDNDSAGQDNEQLEEKKKVDEEPVPATNGGSSDVLPADASAGPAKAPDGAGDSADDNETNDDENVTSLKVTVGSNDVSETHINTVCDRVLDMTIVASLPQTSGTKCITVDVPTGWIVMGYSRLDSDTNHQINLVSGNIGESQVAGKQIFIDNEYKDAIESVTLEPNLDDTVYGTVVCPNNKWEAQNLDGWSGSSRARVFGGKLTYTLADDAANVKLLIRLRPQPFIFPRTESSEEMPPVTVTLSSQHGDEDPVTKTATMETTATSMGVPSVYWPNYTDYNLMVAKEKSSVRFNIDGRINQYNGTTGNRASVSLADEINYTLTYPPGVFYSPNQSGATPWGEIVSVNEDPVNGGGTVVMKADKTVLVHSNQQFRLYFEARAGEGTDFHPDCEKVYGKDNNPETFRITGTGTVTRAGETRDLGTITYKRNVYVVDEGDPAYAITVNSSTKIRRDLVKECELDEYDILLASAGLTCKFGYKEVPFHFVNEDNKLGITGIRMTGRNVKDLVIKTFFADGTEGHTITLPGPYGSGSWSNASSGSHMIAGKEIGLEEGEYISEVYLTTDVQQLTYTTTYLSGGIAFMGQYLDNTAGKVNISIVKKPSEGVYVDEVAKNAETGKDIAGYAACKPGVTTVGAGSGSTVTSKTQGGSHNAVWYPNDVVYYRSTIGTSSVTHTQDTLIDPTITIALPEGIDLQTTSVQGQSLAGNHKDNSWFDLRPVGDVRQIEVNGVTWNCYNYTSVNPLDMVANENATNEGDAGGTVTNAEQQMSVRFEAVISTTCPQYALYTQHNVLWYIGGGPEGNVVNGTGGESFVVTDTADRMGLGTSAKAMVGKNQYSIKPLVGLGMDLSIRAVDNPEADWLTWLGGDDTVATVHEGKPAEVKLSYISKSESEEFKDTIIYLPIPKKGACYKYLNNKELAAPVDVSDPAPFEFTANLTGPIKMVGIDDDIRWETHYAVSAESNTISYDSLDDDDDRDGWEPVMPSSDTEWYTESYISDNNLWDQVVMAKFIALDDILPGKEGEAVFVMNIDSDAQFGSYDYWRGYGRAKLGGGANNWKYTSVIAATPTSATFLGQIFIDENVDAAFDNTGDKPERGYGTNFSAELTRDDGATTPVTVAVADDGVMTIVDIEGRQIYLRKGDYTLTVTRADEETVYDYEQVESSTKSSAEKWYNDIKNANISGAVATHKFTVDKSVEKTRSRAADSNIKAFVYYAGVGLAKLNDFSFTKLGEVEGAEGNATLEALEGAKFALYTDKNCTVPALRDGAPYEAASGADGKVEFSDIVAGTYYMKETALPEGTEDTYFANTTTYKVVVSNDAKVEITRTIVDPNTGDTTKDNNGDYSINNRQKTSITGIKIWRHDSTDNPSPITISILDGADEVIKTVTVIFEGEPADDSQVLATQKDDGSWTFTVDGLNKFKDGVETTYSIAETALDGYLTSQEGNTITNIKKTEATVKKVWNDGNDAEGKRPSSLEVSLYQKAGNGEEKAVKDADGNAVTKTLPVSGKWEATVQDLPKYDKDGNEITYSWKEPEAISNYELTKTDVTGTVTTFTNTLLKEVSVEKTWVGPQTKVNPDNVTVNLLKGETKIDSAELSESNTWKHTFTSNQDYVLYAYDEQGNKIEYSITEDEVNGYKTKVTGPETVGGNDSFTVTNTYDAKGSITFSGTKSISHGREIKEGEIFTFTVKEGEEVVATGTSDATGKITFAPISYVYNKDKDDVREHTYTVTEETYKFKDGVKNSEESYTIHVDVTDEGDGTLKAIPAEDVTRLDFENPYDSKGEISVDAEKTLENREFMEGDAWTFTIAGEDEAPLPVNESGEKISSVTIKPTEGNKAPLDFGTFKYTLSDLSDDAKVGDSKTFTYTITESGEIAGVKNDPDTDRTLKINVTDEGTGELKVELTEDSEEVKFTNTYETAGEITFSGKKTLQGKTLSEGEFSFELYDKDGKLLESVSNKADGTYSFKTLSFTGADLDKDKDGNYTNTTKKYKVVEKKGTDPQITYDTTEYNITATLTDDKQGTIKATADPSESSYNFNNTYTPEDPDEPEEDDDKDEPDKGVKTGDDNNLTGWITLMLLAGAGIGVTFVYRRRRRDNE